VPLGVGVLGEESDAVLGEVSSSTSGVNGCCLDGCFGAIEVVSESTVDEVAVVVPGFFFRDVGDEDRLLGALAVDDASTTVTCFNFVFAGVLVLDLLTVGGVVSLSGSSLLLLTGLLLADEELTTLTLLSPLLLPSPTGAFFRDFGLVL
jgi:hypothetical protein